MQLKEVRKPVLLIERIKRQVRQDVKVGTVRIHNVNVLDECHLFKHIKVSVALTRSAVDNGKGQRVSVLKNQQCGYNVEFVDFAGDVSECGAGIGTSFKFDSEKQIGLIDTFVNAWILIEGKRLLRVLSDFVSGELEEEINGLPFVEACFLLDL